MTSSSNSRPAGAQGASRTGRPNTLGLHDRELASLLDSLDRAANPKGNATRDFVRWPYRRASVRVKVLQSSGAVASLTLACRNISRGGIALLHNCYMHPGVPVMVMLPHPELGEKPVPGRVVRCTHRSGVIHEIGVAFARPVDVRDLLRPDLLADFFCLERVKPGELKGTLLYVDGSDADTRLVKQFLRGTGLTLKIAPSLAEGLASITGPLDLVLCSLALADGTAADFITQARQKGCAAPVIVVTSDTSEAGKRKLTDVKAHAFLAKPLAQERLMRAIAEFLVIHAEAAAEAAAAAAKPPDPAAQQAQEFLRTLEVHVKRLSDAIMANDAAGCRAACLHISGAAPGAAQHALADLAREAALSLAAAPDLAGCMKQLRALIEACEQVKPRKAA